MKHLYHVTTLLRGFRGTSHHTLVFTLLQQRYGTLRLWGAVGFGIASFISGYVSDSSGGRYEGVMAIFVVALVLTFAASTRVSFGGDAKKSGGQQEQITG